MSLADWAHLLLFQLSLSLLAVGGAVTLAPEMHRYLVQGQGWLGDAQFNASIALAQAAPGPNVLFIALLGWNIGLNAAGGAPTGLFALASATFGAAVCVAGVLTPSSLLTLFAARWAQRHQDRLAVRAFRQGLSSLVVGIMLATSWLLAQPSGRWREDGLLWLLTAVTALLVWRTRLHLLWLLAAGALLGALGWV